MSIYSEKDVDYVLDVMKNKYKEFKKSEIVKPYHLKANETLKTLLEE
jgi:hypothetical protein